VTRIELRAVIYPREPRQVVAWWARWGRIAAQAAWAGRDPDGWARVFPPLETPMAVTCGCGASVLVPLEIQARAIPAGPATSGS